MMNNYILVSCPSCGGKPKIYNEFSPLEEIYYSMCQNSKCNLFETKFSIDEWNKDMNDSIKDRGYYIKIIPSPLGKKTPTVEMWYLGDTPINKISFNT